MKAIELKANLIRSWLPKRRADSHKGDYGHTLVVAGSRGMAGAGVLAAWGALRGGSGLVTLATVQSRLAAAAAKLRPEAMTIGLPETAGGSLSLKSLRPLIQCMERRRVTSLALGPGLSRDPETASLVRRLLRQLAANPLKIRGLVLDADGLLAAGHDIFSRISLPIVVTPHPGEFKKISGQSVGSGQPERIRAAGKFATLNKVVCILKGHRTVISDGRHSYINTTGNPGMAHGGSGDVLTGLIAALISQFGTSLYLLRAACVGVYVHGLAGDLAAKEKTQIAMLAGDLAEQIPAAFKKIS